MCGTFFNRKEELADASRLSSMVSKEEKPAANQYFQIGRRRFPIAGRGWCGFLQRMQGTKR
ncbi:MAG: hypothetical protein OSJ28_11550 [Desulfovibrio sp.]|nr:hypothetical protein [Desulfovibrio sp.]